MCEIMKMMIMLFFPLVLVLHFSFQQSASSSPTAQNTDSLKGHTFARFDSDLNELTAVPLAKQRRLFSRLFSRMLVFDATPPTSAVPINFNFKRVKAHVSSLYQR